MNKVTIFYLVIISNKNDNVFWTHSFIEDPTFSTLWANSSDKKKKMLLFLFLFQKTGFDISC